MRLADRLKKSLQGIQRETTSSEFVLWKVYLKEEVNYFHREDHFLAQIAMLLAAIREPKKTHSLKQFLIKFEEQVPSEEVELTEEEEQEQIEATKATWLGALGMKT